MKTTAGRKKKGQNLNYADTPGTLRKTPFDVPEYKRLYDVVGSLRVAPYKYVKNK